MFRIIKASKAKRLALIDEVAGTGESIVITKKGKAACRARATPGPEAEPSRHMEGQGDHQRRHYLAN
jgi:antitoxin (DNA-binding transcriptional repressor) of toxin-antitoxin stability system